MKPNITTHTRYTFDCPTCNHESFDISHLMHLNIAFGIWYCKRCGQGIEGRVQDRQVETELTGKREPVAVLLEIPPQKESIFLTLDSWVTEGEHFEGLRYVYEEKRRPSDLLGVEVALGRNSNPKGLIKLVGVFSVEEIEAPAECFGVENGAG